MPPAKLYLETQPLPSQTVAQIFTNKMTPKHAWTLNLMKFTLQTLRHLRSISNTDVAWIESYWLLAYTGRLITITDWALQSLTSVQVIYPTACVICS